MKRKPRIKVEWVGKQIFASATFYHVKVLFQPAWNTKLCHWFVLNIKMPRRPWVRCCRWLPTASYVAKVSGCQIEFNFQLIILSEAETTRLLGARTENWKSEHFKYLFAAPKLPQFTASTDFIPVIIFKSRIDGDCLEPRKPEAQSAVFAWGRNLWSELKSHSLKYLLWLCAATDGNLFVSDSDVHCNNGRAYLNPNIEHPP